MESAMCQVNAALPRCQPRLDPARQVAQRACDSRIGLVGHQADEVRPFAERQAGAVEAAGLPERDRLASRFRLRFEDLPCAAAVFIT